VENNGQKRSMMWVSFVAFLSYLIPCLIILLLPGELKILIQPNYSFFTLLIYFMAIPIVAIIGLAIEALIYHLIAELFNGKGKWDRLVLCFAAVQAPNELIIQLVDSDTVSIKGYQATPGPDYYKRYVSIHDFHNWCIAYNERYRKQYPATSIWLTTTITPQISNLLSTSSHVSYKVGKQFLIP
jgi:hypothetical protein